MNEARRRPSTDQAPLATERLALWIKLVRTQRQVEARLRGSMRGHSGFTLPRFELMAELDRRPGGLRMSELSALLSVTNGNVTGLVERLVGEGLVERFECAGDRRAMMVRLTAEGSLRFAELAARHDVAVDAALSELDQEAVAGLSGLLSRIGPGIR